MTCSVLLTAISVALHIWEETRRSLKAQSPLVALDANRLLVCSARWVLGSARQVLGGAIKGV